MQPQRRPPSSLSPEKAFGLALQESRKKRGLSQEQLGFETGYHPTYISQLERGRKSPTLRAMFRLAGVLGVRAWEMVRRAEERLHKAGSRR